MSFYTEEIDVLFYGIVWNCSELWALPCYIPALIAFLGLKHRGHTIPLNCHEAVQVISCDR
jgi:hypothetical protein